MFEELHTGGKPLHDNPSSDDSLRGAFLLATTHQRETGDAEDAGSQGQKPTGKAEDAKSQSQKATKSHKAKKPPRGTVNAEHPPIDWTQEDWGDMRITHNPAPNEGEG